ncbi:MAG TPA: NAD-dependent epimerase/dehydratase family protein [Propionibacteriaceae bacterium]
MKVLLVGASGYIGSVVLEHLLKDGHEVVALVRTTRSLPFRVEQRVADLSRPESMLPVLAADVDAVVHAGAPIGDWDVEIASVHSLLRGLRGGRRTFVYLSGTWVLGPSPSAGAVAPVLDEFSPVRPIELVKGRERLEETVTDAQGCRGVVIRPGLVHGRGGGIPGLLVDWARQHGVGRFVATERPTSWPMVHVDDVAALVSRVLVDDAGGQLIHAVAEPGVAVQHIAAAADVAAGGPGRTEPWPLAEAGHALGVAFAEALATSQHVRGLEAPSLGWHPTRPGVVEDLRRGSYQRLPDLAAS